MAERYIATLMHSREQAHVYHLTTSSFAEHKALQAYYEGIVPLFDAWAEAYMGKYGRLRKFSVNSRTNKDPRKSKIYFRSLLSKISKIRLPRDSYLKNIQDEVLALIRSTLYMLSLK